MKFLFLLLALVLQANAGEPAVPTKVKLEWGKFQAALKADDLQTLATMVKFPLRSNEFGGDIKSAKVLADRYKIIFPRATKRHLAVTDLRPKRWNNEMHYEVMCDVSELPIRFIFDFKDSKLLLTTIDNVNE